MTAVEWLVEQFETYFENKVYIEKPDLIKMLELAKEMEKQQQDEFAIGFAEWLVIRYNEDIIYDEYTTKELLEIYKKEQGL